MFDFQNLEVYRKSISFYNALKSISRSTGLNKIMADQQYRAALSIPLNIAEGSGRFTPKDRRNFFIIARSSVFECVAIIDLMNDEHPSLSKDYHELIHAADEISRMLYTLIKNLEKTERVWRQG